MLISYRCAHHRKYEFDKPLDDDLIYQLKNTLNLHVLNHWSVDGPHLAFGALVVRVHHGVTICKNNIINRKLCV